MNRPTASAARGGSSSAASGLPDPPMGKSREPQIILKTDQRNVILELGLGENSKRNQVAGTRTEPFRRRCSEVAVRNGRWVLTHAPAEPRPARPPAQHYFPTEE
jgi:hypothetical protein